MRCYIDLTATKEHVHLKHPRFEHGVEIMTNLAKNKTNNPILRNSHPSTTANKAIHSLKIGAGVTELM